MSMDQKPILGISCGDVNGIGLEVIIKAFSNTQLMEFCTPVLFASNKVLNYYNKMLADRNLKYTSAKDWKNLHSKSLNVFTCWQEDVNIQPGILNADGGKYAIRSLEVAVQCLKDKEIDALITAPIHKKNVQSVHFNHSGHTPYLRETFNVKDVCMMLCTDAMRVALVTEHVAVADISKHLNENLIIQKAEIVNKSLIEDFGIEKPKIAVLALNPHAGDDGLIGQEEKNIIAPAIEKLKLKNILAFGPYAADGFFARSLYKNFDCVLAMYHDQGLIPFKALDQNEGVNFTAGLPIVRTSPDHGTGFEIAGRNMADETSFLHAIYTCIDILKRRKGYAENTKNKLEYGKFSKKVKRSKEDIVED